jgi:xanthine dehydrogenase accessory factor
MRPWATIAEGLKQHGRCAMVTVASVQGSAPREVGARLVVMPDGGFRGTIGGGALEWRALAEARTLLAEAAPQARLRRQALGPELGQCCGGSLRLLIEVFDRSMADQVAIFAAREASGDFTTAGRLNPASSSSSPLRRQGSNRATPVTSKAQLDASLRWHDDAEKQAAGALARTILDGFETPRLAVEIASNGTIFETFAHHSRRLYLFGAGHVGRALILALAPLPFDVMWIDPRRTAFPSAMPANVRAVHLERPAAALAGAPAGSFVLVMTHSHALDLELVDAALSADRFGYVGLIGSATKRARFLKRLKDSGLSSDALSHLVCPIGLAGIASKAPAAIAASVAADLLIRHEAASLSNEPVAVMAERA